MNPVNLPPRQMPPSAPWVLWGALLGSVTFLCAIAALLRVVQGHAMLMKREVPILGVVLPVLAAAPWLLGVVMYLRNVVRGVAPTRRAARDVASKLIGAKEARDAGSFARETIALLDGNFLGASIVSWALFEASALLAAISAILCDFGPLVVALLAIWFVSMLFTAPTAARRDGFRRKLLRAGGLDDAAAEQLLALAALAP